MADTTEFRYDLDTGGYAREVMTLNRVQADYVNNSNYAIERMNNMQVGLKTFQGSMQTFASGLSQFTGSLATLGLLTKDSSETMNRIRSSLMMIYSVMQMFSTLASIIRMRQVVETVRAGAESAIPTNWPKIPTAVVGAGMVLAVFGGGTAIGYKFGSGDWNFENTDISTPEGRRKASQQFQSVRGE